MNQSSTKPRPTLATLEPLIWEWAADWDLIDAEGKPLEATPMTQFGKTVEEIGEARYARLFVDLWCSAQGGNSQQDCIEAQNNYALELGDILVTLSILCRMLGTSLEQSIRDISNCPQLYLRGVKPWTFDYIDHWAEEVQREIIQGVGPFRPMIGVLCRCVQDSAHIQLSMSAAECLELAWLKIKDRQGETVGGVFVKAEK